MDEIIKRSLLFFEQKSFYVDKVKVGRLSCRFDQIALAKLYNFGPQHDVDKFPGHKCYNKNTEMQLDGRQRQQLKVIFLNKI